MRKTRIFLVASAIVCCYTVIGQNPWKTNGNNLSDGDVLGSSNNKPLIFIVNGQEAARIKKNGQVKIDNLINKDTAIFNGFVKFGNQINGDAIVPVGGVLIPGPPHDVVRFTTNIASMMGSNPAGTITQPLTAFGINTQTPGNMLDVNAGDINIITTTRAYKIGNNQVLWHKGNVSNIFVGVGAGNSNGNVPSGNTYVGNNAGFSGSGITPNTGNTYVGFNAGFSNANGGQHTLIGLRAGFSLNNAFGNTFVGDDAGHDNIAGGESVYVGHWAGKKTLSSSNTFVGYNCGANNIGGIGNSFFGTGSGVSNITGNSNTLIGDGTSTASDPLNNTSCLGWGALASSDNVVAIGSLSNAGGKNSISIGESSSTTGDYVSLVGSTSTASGIKAVVAGYASSATGNQTTVLGAGSSASGKNASTLGFQTTAAGNTATAIGANSSAPVNNTIILGDNTVNVGIGLSGNATGPQNALEITSAPTNPQPAGLRFTNLTSTAIPVSNPGAGVLAVNSSGDVIYVTGGGGTSLGNICGGTSNPLGNNYEIPMAGFNFNYTMPAGSTSQVLIGSPICTTSVARLGVTCDNLQVAGGFVNNTNATATSGVFGGATNNSGTAIGVNANASGASGFSSVGVNSTANSSVTQFNLGVNGNAANGTTFSIAGNFDVENSTSPMNIGHQSDILNASASSTNFGSQIIINTVANTNYGVHATVSGGSSNIAIFGSAAASGITPPPGPNYAGYFNGDVIRTGTDNFTSDINLKQNLDTIDNALNTIMLLKPKTFTYKQSSFPSMSLPGGKQYGLIAQDVQPLLPELVNNIVHPAVLDSMGNVTTPSVNYLGLEYQQLTAIMIKAIQEQQHQIDSMKAVMSSCCSSAQARTAHNDNTPDKNKQEIKLTLPIGISISEARPNPNNGKAEIDYFIPSNINNAKVTFMDMMGRNISEIKLNIGYGTLSIDTKEIPSGVYSFTLIADGKVIDTRKMMKQD